MKIVNILSLGAGVQSTVVALMMHRGELLKPEAAIFADPGEEHPDTYTHLAWLVKEVEPSYPVLIRTAGTRLGDDLSVGRNTTGGRFASIPAFTKGKDGAGIMRRQCTKEYKVDVVERSVRRDVLGLKPRQRIPNDVKVVQWFGLSAEEAGRIARVRQVLVDRRAEGRFPLFEMGMDRKACQGWLEQYGVPHRVRRSACVFCPFKENSAWRELQQEGGPAWERAVEIDRALRVPGNVVNRGLNQEIFLHSSCLPIEKIDFTNFDASVDKTKGQLRLGFDGECEGMCGL